MQDFRWFRRGTVVALFGAAVGLFAACAGSTAESSSDPQLQLGAKVFATKCAGCHGPKGGGGFGLKLSDGAVVAKFPDPAAERAVIANGRNNMPKWSSLLTAEEIDAVVRYTRESL